MPLNFDGYYRVLFSRLPDAPNGDTQFIELENKHGHGVSGGEWVIEDADGHVELSIPAHPAISKMYEALSWPGNHGVLLELAASIIRERGQEKHRGVAEKLMEKAQLEKDAQKLAETTNA